MSIEIFLPKKHNNNNNNNQNKDSNISNKFVGLYNHGNTCYLNSLIQILYMSPNFRYNIFNYEYNFKKSGPKIDCIPYQINKLFSRLFLKLRSSEETTGLTRSFQWTQNEVSEQNDIQELLHVLFDSINLSFYNTIFQGEIEYNIKCKECENVSSRIEEFIDLSLPVKSNLKMKINNLEKSFEEIFKIEIMEKDNMYFCEKCNKKVIAESYMKIKKFPKNLILCLNRFEYDLIRGIKKKINTEFEFPEKIEEINGIKTNYFLYGIIVHSGSAMNGHYYSIIKNYEDDNKWYKFDDSNVYEIENFNELYDKIKGNENNQNDNTAYLLFYIENSEIENIKNLNFKVNENLLNDINEEEEIYRKQIEEEKERLSYINLKINHDNKVDFIRIKKTETLKNFKIKIYDLYQIDKTLEGRIIIYDNRKSKILNVFEKEKDEEILENLNFTSNFIYDLETKKENEEFEKFDPNDLFVDIILWNENYLKQNKNEIEKNFQKIKINKNMNFEELSNNIKNNLNLNNENVYNLLIIKKEDYSVNNFNFIEFKKETKGKDFFNNDNLKLYIEINKSFKESSFINYFESKIPNIKVLFNEPISTETLKKIKKVTVKSYSFNKSLEINPKKTIKDLKLEISKILNISIDTFIMKKNSHNGVEIKKLSEKIEKYSTKVLNLYIAFGTPVSENDIKLKVQQYINDYNIFAIYPYKIIDLGIILIDKTLNLKNLIEKIERNEKFNKEENKKLFLRQENNFKPGKIYLDENEIIENNFKENDTLICQYINNDNLFISNEENVNKNDLINFSIRIFDHFNWKISEPYELIINKKITVENLIKTYLSKIKFNNIENYEEFYGIKLYINEMNYFMDEILNLGFIPLKDYKETFIENFPFLINDGCVLLLKNMDVREPNEKEKEYFFKNKLIKKTNNSKNNKNKKENIKTNFNPKYDTHNVKEKAMKITVKYNEENNLLENENNINEQKNIENNNN